MQVHSPLHRGMEKLVSRHAHNVEFGSSSLSSATTFKVTALSRLILSNVANYGSAERRHLKGTQM